MKSTRSLFISALVILVSACAQDAPTLPQTGPALAGGRPLLDTAPTSSGETIAGSETQGAGVSEEEGGGNTMGSGTQLQETGATEEGRGQNTMGSGT